jgi:thiol-disulfide isomerase/thioredoxin
MKSSLFPCILIFLFLIKEVAAQPSNPIYWQASVQRMDGKSIPFQIIQSQKNGKTSWFVKNAKERMPISDWKQSGDSVFFTLPAFEVSFRARMEGKQKLKGQFIKITTGKEQYWPFEARAGIAWRFEPNPARTSVDISGKWDVTITRPNGTTRKALAIFSQHNNSLTGTFLTPSADYRYLDGIVSADSLKLSSFDGDNIRLFEARIVDDKTIDAGFFYNGYTNKESWVALKKDNIPPPEALEPTQMREGQTHLNFRFKDLQGNWVSINDEVYKHKVVIIQLMGSWCANCLDETRFLIEFYKANHAKGLEILALTYEYSTDEARSIVSIEKFKKLLGVPWPILLTRVTAGDDQKAEKTLPQLTVIRSFPTTLILDREGRVRKIETSFYGPGSGEYYRKYVQDFNSLLNKLIGE